MSFASGRKDDLLWKISKCAKSTHENHCRNLTRLIYNEGAALDIEMNYVSITCRKKRPRIHDVKVHWPVLSMHSWCQYIFTHHPGILLGGHRRSNKAGWEMMLQTFWNRFRDIKPDHCVFSSSKPLARCIPFMTHGDEGVTHRRVPFMVQSWQPVISFLGPDHTAISGSPGFSINSVFIYVYFGGLLFLAPERSRLNMFGDMGRRLAYFLSLWWAPSSKYPLNTAVDACSRCHVFL